MAANRMAANRGRGGGPIGGGRKPPAIAKQTVKQEMPPPPNPSHTLGPEIAALSDTYKAAVVQTADIISFFSDAKRTSVGRYAPYPPRALSNRLGKQLEKYDKLCDVAEAQLLRAIAVLQRDIRREQEKLLVKTPIPSPAEISEQPSASDHQTSAPPDIAQMASSSALASLLSARRSSSISLSSLKSRPLPFPLKLDLSDAALRPPIASPVTLAPKTARSAIDATDDFLSSLGASAIDGAELINVLQQSASVDLAGTDPEPLEGVNAQPGDSADQPIELDLFSPTAPAPNADVDSLFTPGATGGSDGMFTPVANTQPLPSATAQPAENADAPSAAAIDSAQAQAQAAMLASFGFPSSNPGGTGSNIFNLGLGNLAASALNLGLASNLDLGNANPGNNGTASLGGTSIPGLGGVVPELTEIPGLAGGGIPGLSLGGASSSLNMPAMSLAQPTEGGIPGLSAAGADFIGEGDSLAMVEELLGGSTLAGGSGAVTGPTT